MEESGNLRDFVTMTYGGCELIEFRRSDQGVLGVEVLSSSTQALAIASTSRVVTARSGLHINENGFFHKQI